MLPATLESSVGLNTVEDYRKKCHICLVDNIGFPTLCNQGDSVGHTFCLECILKVCTAAGSFSAPCPLCRLPLNINDYLISRELHLIQSEPMDVAMTYISHMEKSAYPCSVDMIPDPLPLREHIANASLIKYFVLAKKEDQQEMISKIYWGNNDLFKQSTEPETRTQSICVKQNLLEIIGNPWSPTLGKKQSREMLFNIFKNGWLVRPLYKETHLTFLHRCHLFIREVMPLTKLIDGGAYTLHDRMYQYGLFIPEYHSKHITELTGNLDKSHINVVQSGFSSTLANRAPTGPLKEELVHPIQYKERIDWNILKRIRLKVQSLKVQSPIVVID